ncbi:MAG: ParB N-terminal domain-containing protein [Desulfomonilaceae bacterium]
MKFYEAHFDEEKVENIFTSERLSKAFTIDPKVLKGITASMKEYGFSKGHPIVLGTGPWTDRPVVVDGHARLKAAIAAGVTPRIGVKYFETEEDALLYHIHCEFSRNTVSEADIKRAEAILAARRKPVQEALWNQPTCASL